MYPDNNQDQAQEEQGKFAEFDIDMEVLVSEREAAMQNTEFYTRDFPLLDNITDAIPITHEKGAPYMGDTTTAGLVRSIPRESIQQLPVFGAVINGSKFTVHAIISSWLLRTGVFNENTFGKGLLSTAQIGTQQALSHGYAAFMCQSDAVFSDYGTTMKLLHFADVLPEPGISDANEAGYFYVDANLPKSRVQKILKNARDNPNTSWDVSALEELLEMKPDGKNYSRYEPDTRNQNRGNSPTYTMSTRYEVGKKGIFPSFCPQITDRPLRVIKNNSKFGFPRILFLVIDPAPLTPFGVSRVRLASPNQNFNNAYYQNVGKMLLFNSDAPLLQRGKFTTPVSLRRKAVFKTMDQNATVELVEMSNGTLQQFPEVMKMTTAQIQNVMGKPTQSSDLGNTSPGAKQQIKIQDNSTKEITNIIENFLRQYGLVALDTMISEQILENNIDENGDKIPNEEELIIDDEAKNAINQLYESQFVPVADPADPTGQTMTVFVPPIGDDNKFTIDWNDFYDAIETMSVEVELSISQDDLEEKKRADVQDALTVMEQNDKGDNPEKTARIDQLEEKLVGDAVPDAKKPVGNPNYTPPQPQQTTQVDDQVSVTQ